MSCCLNTWLWIRNGCAYKCYWCNVNEWYLQNNNYIMKFRGKGKYNGMYMCVECFAEKMFCSLDTIENRDL